MKKLTTFIVLLVIVMVISPGNSYTQETTRSVGIEDFMHYQRVNHDISKRAKNPYEQIKGDPYLFKNYAKGEIATIDGFKYNGKMRYNMYEDEIEYLVNDDNFWVSNPWVLEHVKIDSITFIHCPEENIPKEEGAYYILLVDGKSKLLLKKSVILKDPVPAKPYIDAKPAEFVNRRDLYYLLDEGGVPEKINSKWELRKLLSGAGGKIRKKIKDISLRKEEDLVRLVEYYNGMGE